MFKVFDLRKCPNREAAISFGTEANFAFWDAMYPDDGREYYRRLYGDSLNNDVLPMAAVAFDEQQPVGIASLVVDDEAPGFGHLTPWIAAAFVDPQHRRQGVQQGLIDFCFTYAKLHAFEQVYAWTHNQRERLTRMGFHLIDVTETQGVAISILSRTIAD